jgi:hypothetical protein
MKEKWNDDDAEQVEMQRIRQQKQIRDDDDSLSWFFRKRRRY